MSMPTPRLLLAAALALFLPPGAPGASSPDESRGLLGTWKPAAAELGGQPMPEAVLRSITLTLGAGTYAVLVGQEPDKGTYTLDTAADPHGMSITGTEGPNRGKTFPAIYALSGDTLRICYDLSGARRPSAFRTAPGTLLYLVTYTRSHAGP